MENKYKGFVGYTYYEAKDGEDLKALRDYWFNIPYLIDFAKRLEENHPEVFKSKITMEFTQEEVDKLALLMGHVVNEYKLLNKFEGLTSKNIETENGFTNYDLMTYNADSEDGLTIHFDF